MFEPRDELIIFYTDKEHYFQKYLEGEEFISRLAYLLNIIGALSHFNLSFQGPNCIVIELILKLGAFLWKLNLWMMNVENKRYRMCELLTTLKSEPNDEFAQEICHHLRLFKAELKHYFLYMECCAYIINLFSVDLADLPVRNGEQEEAQKMFFCKPLW